MRCVYTVLLGEYENLVEQPMARKSAMPFICLTDNPNLASTTWEIRVIEPVMPLDSVRSQRYLKIVGHPSLEKYSETLYIDNSVKLMRKPEEIFERYGGRAPLALPLHSFRATVKEEFEEVSRRLLDKPELVAEQLSTYADIYPEILAQRPFWTAILIRDHSHPELAAFEKVWSDAVFSFSRRDQLSINASIFVSKLPISPIDIPNMKSWFHRWPVAKKKKNQVRYWQGQVPAPGWVGKRAINYLVTKARNFLDLPPR